MNIAILSYEYPPETGFGGIGTYSYYPRKLSFLINRWQSTTRPCQPILWANIASIHLLHRIGLAEFCVWWNDYNSRYPEMLAEVRRRRSADVASGP